MANNTAFEMGHASIMELKRLIIQKEKRMDYYRVSMNEEIDRLAFILYQYPILINHHIWSDVERKIVMEKQKHPNLKSTWVNLHNFSSGTEILIIDYAKNTSYVREQK